MMLKGKTAIVTGASGKLGAQIALALANAGCKCVCHWNKNESHVKTLLDEIHRLNGLAIAVQADLTTQAGIDDLFEKTLEIGIPQILVNSAAIFKREKLDNVTFESAEELLRINLVSPIVVTRQFAKIIHENFQNKNETVAKIINITDIAALRPWAQYSAYAASKSGLTAATMSLAKELAPRICVNAVAPGVISFPEWFTPAEEKRQIAMVPLARKGRPDEIADTVLFLAANDYITGQVIAVDGGRSI